MEGKYYGGDSGIPEGIREPLYREWTEYRDWSWEDPERYVPQIDDFRVGFVRGYLSRAAAHREAFIERVEASYAASECRCQSCDECSVFGHIRKVHEEMKSEEAGKA